MSDVREFDATGDPGVDDTASIRHAVNDGDGTLHFPSGTYGISKTIEVPLAKRGRCAISGGGRAIR